VDEFGNVFNVLFHHFFLKKSKEMDHDDECEKNKAT
jgi:hypothetical protein